MVEGLVPRARPLQQLRRRLRRDALAPARHRTVEHAPTSAAFYYVCFAVADRRARPRRGECRRSGIGRSVIAVRDNESSAAAYTVSPTRMKLVAFAVAGGIAALAGGLFAGEHHDAAGAVRHRPSRCSWCRWRSSAGSRRSPVRCSARSIVHGHPDDLRRDRRGQAVRQRASGCWSSSCTSRAGSSVVVHRARDGLLEQVRTAHRLAAAPARGQASGCGAGADPTPPRPAGEPPLRTDACLGPLRRASSQWTTSRSRSTRARSSG